MAHTTVMRMLIAQIRLEISHALVLLATLGLEMSAIVSTYYMLLQGLA